MLGVRSVEHIGLGGGADVVRLRSDHSKIFDNIFPTDHVGRRGNRSSRACVRYVGALYIGLGSGCGAGEDITVNRDHANGGVMRINACELYSSIRY